MLVIHAKVPEIAIGVKAQVNVIHVQVQVRILRAENVRNVKEQENVIHAKPRVNVDGVMVPGRKVNIKKLTDLYKIR